MRLISGPAGSGKTFFVLEKVREVLRSGRHDFRLLVPTATLAQHLRNQLAREGFVFSANRIVTLHGFVDEWVAELPQVPPAVLALIVERSAERVNRPEFTRVANLPGFCRSLGRTIDELSSAGCDSERLARSLPTAPLAAAFLAIYREVDRELARRGLATRALRLERAAEAIRQSGVPGITTIWLDGFHALPDPELRFIAALGRHTDLTITLADQDLTPEVRSMLGAYDFREERAAHPRGAPAMMLMRAPGVEREVEEIARRILEQSAAGRPFREIGIVVRSPEIYAPLLRATFERFGIPARFYFDSKFEEHAVARYLTGLIDAMLAGWDHAQTLAALRLAPAFADSRAMDEFDFAVRERIPGRGLDALQALLRNEEGKPKSEGAERLLHQIGELAAIEEWRSRSLPPGDWAQHLRSLRGFFRPLPFPDRIPHEEALLWRGQAAALDLFDEALDHAAMALDAESPIALPEFWRCAKAAIRLTPLRLRDARRNVVQVLPAYEARQWVLPVVFVCGMVEKQFPRFHQQDPFFPDAARCRLNDAGVRIRTAADFEHEERALFQAAVSRATILTVLSYPEFDVRGESHLPSTFLEDLPLAAEQARPVRPSPRHIAEPAPAPRIRDPRLQQYLLERTASLSPTRLESFLQCPFQHFAGRTLRLVTTPELPKDRLDFLTQGIIVHEVLASWYGEGGDIATLFESVFERVCAEKNIQVDYHTERKRNAMLDDLRAFVLDGQWPRGEFTSRMEEEFAFPLGESVVIKGKIDRIDTAPDGRAYVFDYKYSAKQTTRNRRSDENLLQAPLYLLAAEKHLGVKPAGMFYIGLKAGVEYVGWSDSGLLKSAPLPENWLENAAQRTLQSAAEIRAGRVEPHPANPDRCRYCDFRDVCRVESAAAAEVAVP